MIYLLIGLYIIFLSYYYDFRHHKNGRQFHFYAILLVLILLAGFRYRLGIDSIRYAMGYQDLPNLSQLANFKFEEHKYDPETIFPVMQDFNQTKSPLQLPVKGLFFIIRERSEVSPAAGRYRRRSL